MKKKQIKPVRIDWVDSCWSGGWHDYKKQDLTCITIGFLYREKKDVYVIAQNWSAHGCGDYMTIPRVAVTKVTYL